MPNLDLSDQTVGHFINLKAFTQHRAFWTPDARLPDWKTVQADLPHLLHPTDAPAKRLFISHRWDCPDHPDPTGWQLRALQKLGRHYNFAAADFCFWYDFMSLPQKPRTPEEERLFCAGRDNIRRTVADCENICLISKNGKDKQQDLAAMLLRGWIVFELYIARSRMKRPLPLYEREPAIVEFGREQSGWDDVIPDIQELAPVDGPEHLFRWLRNQGIICTNGSDLAILAGFLHEELTRTEHRGYAPEVTFGEAMILNTAEISQLGIVASSRCSMRFPEIYMEQDHFDPATGLWIVTFRHRPPLPLLNVDMPIAPSDIERRLIDPVTGKSPMYPGIRFEVSAEGDRLRAEVA